jgi:hypothetical protein
MSTGQAPLPPDDGSNLPAPLPGQEPAREPDDELVPPPDPRLTLPARRLAGSNNCLNCGTVLAGPYCHYCGQPDRDFMRFFPVLLRDLLADTLDFDSRFLRTLLPLLFRPGRLTREYLDGRRSRYTPPLRLYLFSSIAFFLVAALASFTMTDIEVRTASNDASPAVSTGVTDDPPSEQSGEEAFNMGEISFNDRPWDAETNPLVVPLMPESINNWINREIGESPSKAKLIQEDPQVIVRQMLDLLPATVFVMLPVVALILKFWYLFSGRYYIEHLVLALHNHAFIFVCLLLLLTLDVMQGWFNARGLDTGGNMTSALMTGIMLWLPVYLVAALRTVYHQSWPMTLLKGSAIGISYVSLLAIASSLVAILGFLLV